MSFCRLAVAALLCPCGLMTQASAQQLDTRTPPPSVSGSDAAAERYEPVFEALRKLAPRGDSVATVHNFTLQRDAIQFHFVEGRLYLLTPVAGHTVGAVFAGRGAVSFMPPLAVERAQLHHLLGDSVLNADISAAVLLFTDSTLWDLTRQLSFAPAAVGGDATGPVGDALGRLLERRSHESESSTLMSGLLNGYANGFFYAHVKRAHGEDLMFQVDPEQPEQIELLRGGKLDGQKVQIVSQFPRVEDLQDSVLVGVERPDPLKLERYQIEATLGKDLDFSAQASIRVTARRAGVRWAPFLLYEELRVDSVLDETGPVDSFFRAKHSPELWVRFATPLAAGDTRSLRVVYHGGLIRYGSLIEGMERGLPDSIRRRLPPALDQWFFLKSAALWFPRYGIPTYGSGQAADMDLTFHAPAKYLLASSGRLVDSRVEGDVRTTHWVTERPAFVASFNVGPFTEYQINDPRIPPVTVHVNREAHIHLGALLLGERDPDQVVGADVANSLAFFTRVFGPPLFKHYYATEIPYGHGQAFPGLIHLSWWTFRSFEENGIHEMFRAHEMAHQWWGIGVEPATYRDAWLSEGFADFAGLWYMQVVLNDNEKFFKHLKEWRGDIRSRRGDALPTGLGVRVAEIQPRDYQVMVYEKGAWVLQMLRNLMLDFRTMKEDAFSDMMRDFYGQYRGRRATTRDFQRVVERHIDLPMDWFFDEWLNGTAIPTYILAWRAEPTPEHRYALHVRIRQEDVPNDFVMPVPISIELAGGEHAYVRVNVRGPVTEATLQLPAEPKALELNPLESVLADVKTEGWD
jgi:Peptidase family M1 domain